MGKRLKLARKLAKLTQQALADKVGVTKQAVYQWEKDQSRPDLDKLMPLCRALEVPIAWLLDGAGNPPPASFQQRIEALNARERALVDSILSGFEQKHAKTA